MHLSALLEQYEKSEKILISFEVCHPLIYNISTLELGMEHYQHHAPKCLKNKQKDGSIGCWKEKKEALRRARSEQPFRRICQFGVSELIVPVRQQKRLLGVFFINSEFSQITPERLQEIAAFLIEYVSLEFSTSTVSPALNAKLHRDSFYQESCMLFIERHYRENIALADLAEQLRVNANYLSGVLRRVNGTTFRQLLTARRLREAVEWLKYHPEFSIMKIAWHCGFQDKNYFSLVFRSALGVTPREYRNRFVVSSTPRDAPPADTALQ